MKLICKNKEALFNFFVEERFEAGIVLVGTEVKSLRAGKANLVDAYARIKNNEIYLLKANISAYPPAAANNHNPTRERKLLLHQKEVAQLTHKMEAKGYTLIPLSLYFKGNLCKVELGLCKGKKKHDKRSEMKKRDTGREIARAIKNR